MTHPVPAPQWPLPKRILLLTYDRLDHLITTVEHSVVGIPADRASKTKASQVRIGDWVLIRVSTVAEFKSSKPARVVGKAVIQKEKSQYPDLLWEEEQEQSRVIFPLRIPVTFDGGPQTKSGCVSWEALEALRFRGKDGYLLETRQQWGKKFTTNVIDAPTEVSAFVDLLVRCAE